MTTSTFSLAMVCSSPALCRCDMRLIGHAEMGVAIHGAVDHVDRIGAQQKVNKARARTFPAVELVLAHQVDEIVLLGRRQGGEGPAEFGLARALDRAQR